jgi:dihydroxyacetone kinase-like predicted kinase
LDHLAGGSQLDSLVTDLESQTPSLHSRVTGAESHASWGFCIQFVIQGENLMPEDIRRHLGSHTRADSRPGSGPNSGPRDTLSTVVAGNGNQVRIHLHAADPEPVLAYGSTLGRIQQVSIQDMDQQNQGFARGLEAASVSGTQPEREIGVVAVASGDGLADLFLGTGCAAVVNGGQTMNPSVEQLLGSAKAAGAKGIILLPNNPNVIPAARQAARQDPTLHVVETRSIPQGIAALLAFSPDKPLQTNLDAMGKALQGVTSVEVTSAVRSANAGGLVVQEGQSVALTDGKLVAAADSPEKALQQALAKAGMGPGACITLYLGQQADREEAQELADRLQAQAEGIQVELIYGGQPHYQYLASLE